LEPDVISVKDLGVFYDRVVGVQGVTFSLSAGGVLALLGPNSSGKSSVLRGILGVVRTVGSVHFLGRDMSRRAPHRRIRDGIGLVPQGRQVFMDMSVEENLAVCLRDHRREYATRLEEVWGHFPRLYERRRVSAGYLSGGEQQMLAIGRALIAKPRLLLLDEPSLGLSPIMVTLIFSKLKEIIASNVAVVLVDQNAVQAMALADHVCVVKRAEMVYSAPIAQARSELTLVNEHIGVG
jgi:branched-chain amino acid transport system ATP-binding protein